LAEASRQRALPWRKVMSTLNGIRKIAAAAALATGTLIASASLEAAQPSAPLQVANLGEMTVLARREARLVDLGTMVVGASRLRTAYADLGALTVTAPRSNAVPVATLGSMTVTAGRLLTVALASDGRAPPH